jgi:hypothetical protein
MLLAKHGADFIDRYIEVARWEPQFCDLLGGVWKSTIPDEIWNGIAAISGPAW